jgi:hypothetical protein
VDEPHTDGKLVCNDSGALSLDELISPGSLILVNILSFLDTPTLKSCRLISIKWDSAILPLLNKRTHLNITSFYRRLIQDKQRELLPRASLHYSIWKLMPLTLDKGLNKFPSIHGAHVKSMCILDIHLSKTTLAWIRELLSVWCPQLTKIHFQEPDRNEPWRTAHQIHRKE